MTTKVTSSLINTIATTQLTGTITNAQLAGSITSDKISSVANTALTGTITNAQLAGSITSDKISSVATTTLTGSITAGQITSLATTQLTGTITNAQLAGSITSDKITSLATTQLTGTITNAQLAGSITADKITSLATTQLTGTLSVSNGGIGAATLTSNAVLLGNGTSAVQTVSPGSSGNVLTSNGTTWQSTAPASVKGLGLGGEVWNNVTGSRAFNTQYTNSRSYPIMVSASTTCSGGARITTFVNGVQIVFFGWQFNGCGAFGGTVVIVPPGATYQLNAGEGVQNWVELY